MERPFREEILRILDDATDVAGEGEAGNSEIRYLEKAVGCRIAEAENDPRKQAAFRREAHRYFRSAIAYDAYKSEREWA